MKFLAYFLHYKILALEGRSTILSSFRGVRDAISTFCPGSSPQQIPTSLKVLPFVVVVVVFVKCICFAVYYFR